MKAKLIETLENVNVMLDSFNHYRDVYVYKEIDDGKKSYELRYFDETQLLFVQKNPVDWEQRYFELVKAAMQGLISGEGIETYDTVAENAIGYADLVIKKLKE